ncbi:uncharacterized protein LOC114874989 [Osmia bicornis bicornis]|uniref:uncharacterized protein LOC114874989 n=1 Tax=Osmia bicornis bicornis TaxID=1437191 RepID=UPI0010F9BB92|nr:uncharacterized protein LOC114874989 [Osmia bicornis bicornis]
MSLSRISNSTDLLTALSRVLPAANAFGEMQCTRYTTIRHTKALHVTSVRRYPNPPTLPLPTNVSEIFANETGRFTPERARDISVPVLLYYKSDCKSFNSEQPSKLAEPLNSSEVCKDTHVDSYDCFGAVSLNGTMQSNVPKPYSSNGKSTHLNMPGGQWARDEKYIAEDMQKSHYRTVNLPLLKLDKRGLASYVSTNVLLQRMYPEKYIFGMGYSTNASQQVTDTQDTDKKPKYINLSKKEKFQRVIKDYGATVVVFHVVISIISLGACYAAVVGGIDLAPLVKFIIIDNSQVEQILTNSSSFLLAYAIHKLLAPMRIGITCGVTPILVQYLRRIKILKPPKVTKTN